jgi:hypothetical protein
VSQNIFARVSPSEVLNRNDTEHLFQNGLKEEKRKTVFFPFQLMQIRMVIKLTGGTHCKI